MYALMMMWQHNKLNVLSKRKAILIPGSLKKKNSTTGDSIPCKIMPDGSWHQVKNSGGNLATHVIRGTN